MKKIIILFIVSIILVGCNEIKEEDIEKTNKETVALEIGDLGNRNVQYEIDNNKLIYIEDGQVIYEDRNNNIKISDNTIKSDVIYLEGGKDCQNNIMLAVLTANGQLYYNTSKDINNYKLDFIQVDIDSQVYGLEARVNNDVCGKDILLAYIDDKQARIIDEKQETNSDGIEQIVGVTLGKTYDELYDYKDIFKDQDNHAVYIYKNNNMRLDNNNQYITYNSEILTMKYLLATIDTNNNFNTIYIIDSNDYLYSINYNNIDSVTKMNDKKVLKLDHDNNVITITYDDNTTEEITNAILHE